MSNWYIQITLLLAAVSSVGIGQQTVNANLATAAIACRDLNSDYQEIYSFETENYYINVCQSENNFYYHRQSKLTENARNVLVPAQPILSGSVFQATIGKTVYFVGIDSDRHYSSVMLNNNEIVFEPEIEPVAAIAQNSPEFGDRNLQNASLELDSPAEAESPILACIRDKSAFHPHLDGWQKLIGKSITLASSYAIDNGYSFEYDREQNPTLALITTKTGGTIDLSVVPDSEIVEQVCIQPTESAKTKAVLDRNY